MQGEEKIGGRVIDKDHKEIVFVTDAAWEKQRSGMLQLCFKSLFERLSGATLSMWQWGNVTRLHTHKKHATGLPMGFTYSCDCLCLSCQTSVRSNKTQEQF